MDRSATLLLPPFVLAAPSACEGNSASVNLERAASLGDTGSILHRGPRWFSCFVLSALVYGCAKKPSPTNHIDMDPLLIRIILEREPITAPTEPAPGGHDLNTDLDAETMSDASTLLLGFAYKTPPWHCFKALASFGLELGGCDISAESCSRSRAVIANLDAEIQVGACFEQPRAACFWLEQPLKDWGGYFCYPTFSGCESSRRFVASDSEIRNVGTCEARRLVDTPQ